MDRLARAFALGVLVAIGWPSLAEGQPSAPAERDWSVAARGDLVFIAQTLRDNHPAFVDTSPIGRSYRRWAVAGLARSMRLAAAARSYAGYFHAVRHYAIGFQDDHLYALGRDDRLNNRWPGFLVTFDGGHFRVEGTAAEARAQGLNDGDRLIGCDGRSAAQLARQRLLRFGGHWSLAGARPSLAPYLLVDDDNPFIGFPRNCQFGTSAGRRRITLALAPIAFDQLRQRIREARGQGERPFALRRFAGGYWLAIPSFATGNPQRATAFAMLLGQLEREAEQIRAAPMLVLDVRGNGGGASVNGERIAASLWGEAEDRRRAPVAHAVDWRATPDNLRHLDDVVLPRFRTQLGEQDRTYRAYEAVAMGMRRAIAAGRPFYRQDEADFYPPLPTGGQTPPAMTARVVVLADGGCASACLDFIDLVQALAPVIIAGGTTSADAVYIDNREVRLPSGLGGLGVSMKVYRDRARGHNQSYEPQVPLSDAAMRDSIVLEHRLASLLDSRALRRHSPGR